MLMWPHEENTYAKRAVAKQITSDLKEELLLTHWYILTTDGSSDKDKFLLVLIRYVDKDSRLIVT